MAKRFSKKALTGILKGMQVIEAHTLFLSFLDNRLAIPTRMIRLHYFNPHSKAKANTA